MPGDVVQLLQQEGAGVAENLGQRRQELIGRFVDQEPRLVAAEYHFFWIG